MSSPRLTSLVIHKYRHVVPGTRLEFGPGFNVLLGRNGTGKTTLLELIEMIWAKGFGQIADEPFHLEYTVEFDDLVIPPDLSTDAAQTLPGCLIRIKVENKATTTSRQDSDSPRTPGSLLQFHYRFIMSTPAQVILEIDGTPLGASLRTGVRVAPVPVLPASAGPLVWEAARQYFDALPMDFRNEELPITDWVGRCSDILMEVHNTGRYDESLGAFQALTSNEYRFFGSGIEGSQWGITRRTDTRPDPYTRFDIRAFFPQTLISRWSQTLAQDPTIDPLEFQDSICDAGMKVFLELSGYRDVIVRSGTPSRERKGVIEKIRFRAPEFRIILQNDRGEIPAQALSYGEKRLLAFLWHLACDPSIIIADELVNGFHHAWIERCVELMTGRQAFLASQNPLLLDCLPLTSQDDVRRSFITCHREPDGQMIWNNLSVEEAADFYRSYQLQIRHTSEILRGQDLW